MARARCGSPGPGLCPAALGDWEAYGAQCAARRASEDHCGLVQECQGARGVARARHRRGRDGATRQPTGPRAGSFRANNSSLNLMSRPRSVSDAPGAVSGGLNLCLGHWSRVLPLFGTVHELPPQLPSSYPVMGGRGAGLDGGGVFHADQVVLSTSGGICAPRGAVGKDRRFWALLDQRGHAHCGRKGLKAEGDATLARLSVGTRPGL